MFFLDYLHHRRDCQFKQNERASRIASLTSYHGPFTALDRDTIRAPIQQLVSDVQADPSKAADVLATYGRVALRAHERTNCLTEVMLSSAEMWVRDGSVNLKGPLAGIPVSLKDTLGVVGYDASVAQSRFTRAPKEEDGAIIRLLKDAGAVPYVKTNLPITMLSFESNNDVWGKCTNPYNAAYTAGGSTGGEAALLALGGRIGIGSDVAGSVRLPAHWSGIYALRCSTGRWPKLGMCTSMPGQDGVPSVYSPMTRTLNDLTYFTQSVVSMKPWTYDPTCHPIPWRQDIASEYADKKVLRVGVLKTDGVVDPSPACLRALETVSSALKAQGHELVDVSTSIPSSLKALRIASQLLCNDGLGTALSFFRWGENNDAGAGVMRMYMGLPRPVKYLYYLWVRYVRRDEVWAGLLKDWHPKTAQETWDLNAERENLKVEWFNWWNGSKLDCLISPPNATPAVPHGGMKDACSSCGYTFLFNLIDYTAGVLPVTHVDRIKDQLPADFALNKLNGVARGAYKLYNADKMHGLPVGVQVIGRRLEEEKVLAIMQRIEDALVADKFQLLEVD